MYGAILSPGKDKLPYLVEGRLTLTTAVPVTTSDVTAATTVYFTPFRGDRISLYSGGDWDILAFSELSIKTTDVQNGTTHNGTMVIDGLTDTSQLVVGMAVTGTGVGASAVIVTIDSATQITVDVNSTADGTVSITSKIPASKLVDVFIFNNAGVAKLVFGPLWTNSTTRATALTTQNGRYVLTGDTTRIYLGTIATTTTAGQTEDSEANRFVWNYYNRCLRSMKAVEATNTWTYTTTAWRQANNSTANQLNFVIGVAEDMVRAMVKAWASRVTTSATVGSGIGVNVTNANSAQLIGGTGMTSGAQPHTVHYQGIVAAGLNFLAWLEYSTAATNTTTWQGDNGSVDTQCGIMGQVYA